MGGRSRFESETKEFMRVMDLVEVDDTPFRMFAAGDDI